MARWRTVAVLVTILLLSPVLQTTQAARVETPDVPRVASSDPAWNVTPTSDGAVANLSGLQRGVPQTLALDVTGARVYSLEARLDQGVTVTILRDDQAWTTLSGTSGIQQVPLNGSTARLVLRADTTIPGAGGSVILLGAKTVLPPAIIDAARYLYGCTLPDLRVVLDSIVPLVNDSTTMELDGSPLSVSVGPAVTRSYGVEFTAPTPAVPEGFSIHTLRVTVHDVTGQVWTVLNETLYTFLDHSFFVGPQDWVYDLQPTVMLESWSCDASHFASYQFLLDGQDATTAVRAGWFGLAYSFDHHLAFNETHAYEFRVTLKDGSSIERSGNIREGLDVDEFDVAPGVLVSALTPAGASVTLPASGQGLPTALAYRTDLPIATGQVALPLGGHVRAVYAPLAIACTQTGATRACDPYGGNAPGFVPWNVAAAMLEVTPNGGGDVLLPGAGQIAEAARRSDAGAASVASAVSSMSTSS